MRTPSILTLSLSKGDELELLFAFPADGIGKIAIKPEQRIFHLGIDVEMDVFHRLGPAGDVIERLIQLGKISGLDRQMEIAELFGRQAQLAAAEPPALDQAALFQMAHIGGEAPRE